MAAIETTATVVSIQDEAAPTGRRCRTDGDRKAYKAKRGQAFSGNNGAKGRGRGTGKGKPRAFTSAEDLIDKQIAYCEYIKGIGYKDYPTKIGFAHWLAIDPRTVYLSIKRYYPEVQKEWQENIEQTLVNGVNAGVYHVTMTIFILKNRCGWADKKETVTTEKKPQIASKAELKEAITAYLQAPVDE